MTVHGRAAVVTKTGRPVGGSVRRGIKACQSSEPRRFRRAARQSGRLNEFSTCMSNILKSRYKLPAELRGEPALLKAGNKGR
jgi:hypothetical protein